MLSTEQNADTKYLNSCTKDFSYITTCGQSYLCAFNYFFFQTEKNVDIMLQILTAAYFLCKLCISTSFLTHGRSFQRLQAILID